MSNAKSSDLDYVYVNAMRIQITGQEVMIVYGMTDGTEQKEGEFKEKMGIVMLPFVAKVLASSLTEVIKQVESQSGIEIDVGSKISVQKKNGDKD